MDDKIDLGEIRQVENTQAPSRRGSIDVPTHSSRPVWEQRETYGPAGIRGIFKSRYVFAAAAFATLGGTLFGSEHVSTCISH